MSLISSLQGLAKLPATLSWAEFDGAIVESSADIRFLGAAELGSEAALFPRGVAFGRVSELRWVQRDSGYHLVYISDSDLPLPGATHQRLLEWAPDAAPERLLLWGERSPGTDALFAGRIPRPLRYPGPVPPAARRAAIKVRHYFLGETRLYRFMMLTWI